MIAVLVAQNISVYQGSVALLQAVSVQLVPQKILAVMGANGAGKSTLLKTLCGERLATQGQIFLNGQALHTRSLREQARVRAVLSQHTSLQFSFSVLDVVLMGRSPHPTHSVRDREIAYAALETVTAGHLAQRDYLTLSGGEQQRVQLARVFAQIWETATPTEPRYLLLDEPTANLDLAQQHAIFRILRQFAQQQVGILVIVHDVNLAIRYADDVLCLKNGQVYAQGTPKQVLTPTVLDGVFGIKAILAYVHDIPIIVI